MTREERTAVFRVKLAALRAAIERPTVAFCRDPERAEKARGAGVVTAGFDAALVEQVERIFGGRS